MRISRKLKKLFKLGSHHGVEIDPDQILLDSSNLTDSNLQRMEGRLIAPLERSSYIIFFGVLFILGSIAVGRLAYLQIANGRDFAKRSATNSLEKTIVFSNRGIIFDRTGDIIVGNIPTQKTNLEKPTWSDRGYGTTTGLSSLIGFVSYPKLDSSGNFFDTELVGKGGVEEYYDDVLSGRNGTLIREKDVKGKTVSESSIVNPKDGINIKLSIDKRVSSRLFEELKQLAGERGFSGGAGVIMDIETGEILAITSFPEFDSQTMTDGKNKSAISSYLTNSKNPFLNRAVQGLYIPGSIVKPYLAVGALEEKIVDPLKQFLANGQITVPNPYDKERPTIFKDWKVHGLVDMRRALAVSSNVYFFTIGGGYEGQRGLGIKNIEKYMRIFGFGEKTGVEIDFEEEGVVPSPEWKKVNFNEEDWRLGDTYNSSIGQYGFLVTPIQAVRAVSAIANGGFLVIPTIIAQGKENDPLKKAMLEKGIKIGKNEKQVLPIARENLQVVKEGMRKGVIEGTASGLNIPAVVVAAKTGTAELGVTKQAVNSWVTGFFPYESPKYAFAIAMERGSRANTVGSTYAMRRLLEWMSIYTPEYLK